MDDIIALVNSSTRTLCNSIHDKSDYITPIYVSVDCRASTIGTLAAAISAC